MKKKLLIILLVISCVPLIAASGISTYLVNKMLVNEYYASSSIKAEELQLSVHNDITKHMDVLKLLAKMPAIQGFDAQNAKPILVEAGRTYPMFQPIVVDNSSAAQLVKSDDTKLLADVGKRSFYQAAMKGQTDVISETLTSNVNGHLIIVMAMPIKSADQKSVTGVVQGTIDLTTLSDSVAKQSQDGITAYIVDREGKMLAHPNKELVASRTDLSNEVFIKKGLQGANGTVDIEDAQGVRKIVNYTVEPMTGWVIVQERPYSMLLEKSHSIMMTTAEIILVTIILVVLLGIYVAKRLTRPIEVILDECEQMAKGDLRSREISITTKDEYGKLAAGFQAMREKLVSLLASIRSASQTGGCV